MRAIAKAEQSFRKADTAIAKELASATRTLRAASLAKKGGASAGQDDGENGLPLAEKLKALVGGGGDGQKAVRALQDRRMSNELAFLSSLSNTLNPEQVTASSTCSHSLQHTWLTASL